MPRFSGIIPPVVTPLLSQDQLDSEGVERVIEHLISGGVHGVFVLGTTGEGPSLTYRVRYGMVERTCEVMSGRLPVLVGVTDNCLVESIHLAEHAFASGATAIVAAAPHYYATNQAGLLHWFRSLADRSPLPLMLYNMPGCVDIVIGLETAIELSSHPNIIGIKDSGGDLEYFGRLCEAFADNEDFSVFMGPEELLPQAIAAGGDGGVCGGGNLLPNVYVDLFHASRAGNSAEVGRLMAVVDEVFQHIYRDTSGNMNLIPALKLAMSHTGLCSNLIAPPLQNVSTDHAHQIQTALPQILEIARTELQMVSQP